MNRQKIIASFIVLIFLLSMGMVAVVSLAQENASFVSIHNFAFNPSSLAVPQGTTVTWTNNDDTDHTVTSTSGPASFDSGIIAPGGTFSFTFTQPGTYGYMCTIHGFTGIIRVTAAAAGNQTAGNQTAGNQTNITGGNMTSTEQPTQGPVNPCDVKESFNVANGTPAPANPWFDKNLTATFGLEKVSKNNTLNSPIKAISPPGDSRLFVADQTGVIWIIDVNGTTLSTPFLDISHEMVKLSNTTEDERGLLSLAFHPDFATNGKFYVYYSAPLDSKAPSMWNCTNHLAEFKVSANDSNVADPSTERTILMINKPYQNNNGGDINFGPDGFLYLPTGDGGRADDTGIGHPAIGNGQDNWELLGKILRIDINENTGVSARNTTEFQNDSMGYGIPVDNSFVATKQGRPEIYAWGFRNPWRASFDQQTGTYFVSNAGQKLWEGIYIVQKGENYGWNIMENGHPYNRSQQVDVNATARRTTGYMGEPLVNPILSIPNYVPGDPVFTSIGGYVYRGTTVPELNGMYIFGLWQVNSTIKVAQGSGMNWKYGNVTMDPGPNGTNVTSLNSTYIQSFGQDSKGEMYVLTTSSLSPLGPSKTGAVWKIVPTGGNLTAGNQTAGNATAGNQTSSGGSTANSTSNASMSMAAGYAMRAW